MITNQPTTTNTARIGPPLSWRESVEWGRKAIHVCSSILALWILVMDDAGWRTGGLLAGALFVIAVDLFRLRMKRWALWFYRTFPLIFRRDERHTLSGASVMMIGATLTSYLFPREPAAAGILCLAWGDSAAAVVGQLVKYLLQRRGLEAPARSRAPVVARRGRKTWYGTAACLLVSAAMIWLVVTTDWRVVLPGAAMAAIMERWTPGRWDNLTIPLAVAAVVHLCFTMLF